MNHYPTGQHPSDEELRQRLDEALPDSVSNQIDEHVDNCPVCTDRLAILAEALEEQGWKEQLGDYDQQNPDAWQQAEPHRFFDILESSVFPDHADDADVRRIVSTLTKYDVIRVLGTGGMGKVYFAIDRWIGRRVALKVIRPELMDKTAVLRFRQEMRAIGRLSHDNIVQILDANAAGSVHYLVMELIEGSSLQKLVKGKGPLPVTSACNYVIQAAEGLQHAHECGTVHRDIKPANLMLTDNGQIKILDFGLARFLNEADARLTHDEIILGSVNYLAPEQATNSHAANHTSDIYSLGCTLFYVLTGQAPFIHETAVDTIDAHRRKLARRLASHRGDIPDRLQIVLDKMMAKKPGERYQSAAEVADALRPFEVPSNGVAKRERATPIDPVEPRQERTTVSSNGTYHPDGFGIDPVLDQPERGDTAKVRRTVGRRLAVVVPLLIAAAWLVSMLIDRGRPKTVDPKSITNSLGMRLVLIPAGGFALGAGPGDFEAVGGNETMEGPQHEVTLTRPFYLGTCEVTKRQYYALTGKTPSHFQGSEQSPVEMVSWFDAVEFCNALSLKERLKSYYEIKGSGADREVTIIDRHGSGYRLPTEAEWEYACRGKTVTRYSFGDDKTKLHEHAWFEHNSKGSPHAVETKLPNPFGLYDMHGNVWEWCWDRFDESHYAKERKPAIDPLGPTQGTVRVRRGGAWNRDTPYARSAFRSWLEQDKSFLDIGFRVARFEDAAP